MVSLKKNRTRINMISVIRSNILYLQTVLIKLQPGTASQYRMQVSNMSWKISYFALQKQILRNLKTYLAIEMSLKNV